VRLADGTQLAVAGLVLLSDERRLPLGYTVVAHPRLTLGMLLNTLAHRPARALAAYDGR
jgi:dihydroorotase-like cyclic amidohydrolase